LPRFPDANRYPLRSKRYGTPIHIGSNDPAKGPFPDTQSPDFAAVVAQTPLAATQLAFCPHIQSNRPQGFSDQMIRRRKGKL
jgi:hypothetical protein